jgi:hypothetical protein
MDNKYYIYAHIRLDTNAIFYIGKGSGKRAYIKSNRSSYWKRIVNAHGYKVIFLEENLSEEDAFNFEISLIATYKSRGNCEANFTIGGDGVRVDKRWWNDKISKALIGKKVPKGKESKSFKDTLSKEVLIDLYVLQNMNTIKISELTGLSIPTICSRLNYYGIKKRNAGRSKVKIKCVEDGIVFDSIMQCANHYGLYRENIKKVLCGKYKHTGNKTFITIQNQKNENSI